MTNELVLVKVPVCTKIGTKEEGWYLDGKLVKQDNCVCVAVCKEKGWYSSCTGELIQSADCSGSSSDEEESYEVTINDVPTMVRQNKERGVLEITSEEETAETTETLRISEGGITVSTTEGEKNINYLPREARDMAIESGLSNVKNIEIVKEDENPTYVVSGEKTNYFLWIIPVGTEDKTVKINAETGETVE